MKSSANSCPHEEPEKVKLLEHYIGEYYEPLFWDEDSKSKNYFAKITPGKTSPFNRTFLNNLKLDERVMFKKDHFKEGDIIEQRSTFKKGKTTQTNFTGFYVIHPQEDGIYGEPISQKDTIESFECKKSLPEVSCEQKNQLKSKLHLVMEHLDAQYGHQVVIDTLSELLAESLPSLELADDGTEESV